VPIHAAGIITPEGTVLLRGRAGAGKSTLTAAAAARGWGVLADEVVWLDLNARSATVRGIPWHIHLDRRGLEVLPMLESMRRGGSAMGGVIACRQQGDRWELEIGGSSPMEQAPIGPLVFLDPPGPVELRPLRTQAADPSSDRFPADSGEWSRLAYPEARRRFDAELISGERTSRPFLRNAAVDALIAPGAYLLRAGRPDATLARLTDIAAAARRPLKGGG
jgi:hypothetical protein